MKAVYRSIRLSTVSSFLLTLMCALCGLSVVGASNNVPGFDPATGEGGPGAGDAPIGQVFPIDQNGPGTLAGSFNVGRNGDASYTIGLEVPKGVKGMAPSLSVNYSGGGNGDLGIGFQLGAADAIVRGSKTLLDDGEQSSYSLEWGKTDALYYGSRLLLASGVYGEPGSVYHPIRSPRTKVVLHSALTAENAWFEVFLPSGKVMIYGQTDDAKSIHYKGGYKAEPGEGPSGSNRVYAWHLDRQKDRYGNEIDYRYVYDNSPADNPIIRQNHRLVSINYGGNPDQGTGHSRLVIFNYEERPDVDSSWFYGGYAEANYRLKTIYTTVNTGEIGAQNDLPGVVYPHRYEFTYDQSPQTKQTRLQSVARCTFDTCLPPTTFTWNNSDLNFTEQPYGYSFAKVMYPDLPSFDKPGTGAKHSILKQLTVQGDGDGTLDLLVAYDAIASIFCPGDSGTWQLWNNAGKGPDQVASGEGPTYLWHDTGVGVRYGKWNNENPSPGMCDGPAYPTLPDLAAVWGITNKATGLPTTVLSMRYGDTGLSDLAFVTGHPFSNTIAVDEYNSMKFGDKIQIMEAEGSGQYISHFFDDHSKNFIVGAYALDTTGDGLDDLLFCRSKANMSAWIDALLTEEDDNLSPWELFWNMFGASYYDISYPNWGWQKRLRNHGEWYFVKRKPGQKFDHEDIQSTGVQCSVEDPITMMDIDGDGVQDMLVVQARDEDGLLKDPAFWTDYQRLTLDPVTAQGTLSSTGLPVDYLQRARMISINAKAHNKTGDNVGVGNDYLDPDGIDDEEQYHVKKPFYLAGGPGQDRACDMNGDGLPDIARLNFVDHEGFDPKATAEMAWKFRFFNSLYDYKYPEEANVAEGIQVYINKGNGTFAPGIVIDKTYPAVGLKYNFDFARSWEKAVTGDVDGDGRCDIIYPNFALGDGLPINNPGSKERHLVAVSLPKLLPKPGYVNKLYGGYTLDELEANGYRRIQLKHQDQSTVEFYSGMGNLLMMTDVNADGVGDLLYFHNADDDDVIDFQWQNDYEGLTDGGKGYWDILTNNSEHEAVHKITDGYERTIEIEYKAQTSPLVYDREGVFYDLPGYPVRPAFSPKQMVYKVHYDSGLSKADGEDNMAKVTQTYKYTESTQDVRGRGYLGVARRRVEEKRLNPDGETERLLSVDEWYHTNDMYDEDLKEYTCVGCLKERIMTLESDGHSDHNPDWVVERLQQHWEVFKFANGSYTNYPATVIDDRYEVSSNICTQDNEHFGPHCSPDELANIEPLLHNRMSVYETDEWGYLTVTTNTTPENVVTSRLTYQHDTEQWLLGRLTKQMVTDSVGAANKTKEESFAYDSKGDVYLHTVEPNNPQYRNHTYTSRDNFGNVAFQMVTDANNIVATARSATTVWSNDGLYPIQTSNSEFVDSTVVWHPGYDLVLRATGANGLSQVNDYDALGRVVASRSYYGQEQIGTESTVSYARLFDETTQTWQLKVNSNNDSVGSSEQRYDRLGRLVYSDNTMSSLSDAEAIYNTYDYNTHGQIMSMSQVAPVNDVSDLAMTYEYDHTGRVTKITSVDGSSQTYQYAGLTTHIIDENGHRRTALTDQRGNIVKATDGHIGYDGEEVAIMCYDYSYPFSQLHQVGPCDPQPGDPLPIVIEPGLYGEQLSITDPKTGTTTNVYNSFGELVETVDAEHNKVAFQYDRLGRQRFRHYHGKLTNPDDDYNPDDLETSEWIYDLTHKGALNEAISPTGDKMVYEYDNQSRLKALTQITGVQSFTFDYSYDELSRLKTVEYPSPDKQAHPFRLRYGYDNRSRMVSVHNDVTNDLYWTLEQTNLLDQPLLMSYGNGTTLTRAYNPVTYRLEEQKTLTPLNWTLQHYTYEWDKVGNLTSRSDWFHQQTEIFGYDSTDRLVEQVMANNQQDKTLEYEYDKWGNLQSKAGLEGYEYHPVTGRLNKTDNTLFFYDDVGNVTGTSTNGQGTVYHWTESNKPKSVLSLPEINTQYTYTVDHVRQQKIDMQDPDNVVTTTYVGGLYQREEGKDPYGDRHTYLISSGVGVIGELSRVLQKTEDGWVLTKENLQYMHPDYLGSASLITSNDQNLLVQRLSYMPFGEQRDPSDWVTENDGYYELPKINWGFTGHDAKEGEFIPMGGRVYHPGSGRFMNADPFVTDPWNPQTYTRYAYVRNNPMSYTDPTGNSEASVGYSHQGHQPGHTHGTSSSGSMTMEVESGNTSKYEFGAPKRHSAASRWFDRGVTALTGSSLLYKDPGSGDAQNESWLGQMDAATESYRQYVVSGGIWRTVGEDTIKDMKSIAGSASDIYHNEWYSDTSRNARWNLAKKGLWTVAGMAGGYVVMRVGGAGVRGAKSLIQRARGRGGRAEQRALGTGNPGVATCPGGVCYCFVAGTLVATEDGLKPIEDIKVGDKVLSRDQHDPNGENTYNEVKQLFITPENTVGDIVLVDEDGNEVTIGVTKDPFFVVTDEDDPSASESPAEHGKQDDKPVEQTTEAENKADQSQSH